ncbi:universal stress protein [Microvirga lotononidis]|uniref:Universal stress protein UspA-like protein n=1 Tax=Microvirga lotononidis TaxID=864069 RepID=I4YV98_9HYPH|nr:universal stress protein [Microvirga lotononidis]EIM27890.1 universal stress protein UspA-like protein [Microvirga lotononidis]WQO27983.1 universal stress protein [Microvirga lotononidis]
MIQNIRSILIGITEEGDAEERSSALPYGLALARQANAHVTVQAASLKVTLTHAFASAFAEELVSAENRRLNALAQSAAEASQRAAAASGIACITQAPQLAYPELLRSFTSLARTHDLTILDLEPISLAVDRGLIEAVLMESGRPLIVVPEGREAFAGERIIVAWDGSAKAARALNDALPFLRAASQVEVISVTGEKSLAHTVPGAEIAPHLARHGVAVSVLSLPVVKGDVAETLRTHAHLTRADMIVMGAYVHSRLREMVLGGTTQSLLKNAPAPLFLSY